MSLQSSGKRMIIRHGRPVFFKTKRASDYQSIIRLFARKYRPVAPWECPITLCVTYYLERPARLNKKSITTDPIPHDKRPDLDNLQKGTQDALEGFWLDDAQICSMHLFKRYCEKGGSPRIVITILPSE
jgi:Holliday junction resolvase RusA-like endonuclease